MNASEAAAFRAGLEAAALVVEDRVPHATGGEIYIIADTAAAIRALPVPESSGSTGEEIERHIIASVIDHPSVYMGGPSARALRLAVRIIAALRAARGQP
jgi:hypothetical protein